MVPTHIHHTKELVMLEMLLAMIKKDPSSVFVILREEETGEEFVGNNRDLLAFARMLPISELKELGVKTVTYTKKAKAKK